jgi:(E)-4-hydroxy-3-methylbut-2-enyl-diphosphate synthase
MEIRPDSFCESLTSYVRFPTREVMVGSLGIGGNNPIRIQSMTTTDTMDTRATVDQALRMIEAGSELVRITAPSKREAENLKAIKEEIRNCGYKTPIVADIHFTPNAALIAATIVEKVRINPGNYADRKKFDFIEYSDTSYEQELDRIRERFIPLVKICKENGVAIRIGTNHGSLSDRILSRYGDTPLGMVESAMEFIRICEEFDYHDLILSMKASNTQVMVQAYRLAVAIMRREGMNYPLHLGVTEAGEGEDGRIKSAVGIGSLLEDGVGDTIRVSLTEDPELEIPVAQQLVQRYSTRNSHSEIRSIENPPFRPYDYTRRSTISAGNIGGNNVPRVIIDLSAINKLIPEDLIDAGYIYSESLDKWTISEQAADFVYIGKGQLSFELPGTLNMIQDEDAWQKKDQTLPLFSLDHYLKYSGSGGAINFVCISLSDCFKPELYTLKNKQEIVLVIDTANEHGIAEQRRAFFEIININWDVPIVIRRDYNAITKDEFQLFTATDLGSLLIDGFGDGIWLIADKPIKLITQTCFGILQATRTRISKTEYISCPSCGRTLFDLQEITGKIRSRTNHLKGVKIGVMGCIVNGPGEMADADYGYVGTGVGQISLYKGYEVVEKNIPSEKAVDALINLIKENGDWVELEK